jgi:hypothetical protein
LLNHLWGRMNHLAFPLNHFRGSLSILTKIVNSTSLFRDSRRRYPYFC